MNNKPTLSSLFHFTKTTGILVWTYWIFSCAGGQKGGTVELDVIAKTLPYSITVLPFEYSRWHKKSETFKMFHLDTIIGQELQRQKFFKDVFFPSTSSSNIKHPSTRLNDLTLRGEITNFQASCIPQSPETETAETTDQPEEKQDERSRWFEEQNARKLSAGSQRNVHGWEWGRSKFNELNSPTKDQENMIPEEKSKPFSFELVKNKVRGKLTFTIQIFGRRTNKIVFKKTYKGEIDEIVTAFSATPETVDDYVSKVLLDRLLKDFLEDLAIDFYQYTQTKEFIRKTNLPSPSAMLGNS